jgi:PAS domain S-box-containing protein
VKGLRARLLAHSATGMANDADPAVTRDHYQSVIDSVASVICTVDRDLLITGVNRRWDEFALANYGEHLTGERVLGTPVLELMRGSRLERWREACREILSGRLSIFLDEVAGQGRGSWRSYTLAASPLIAAQGQIVGITLVATDITRLKKAEAEMLRRLVEIRGFRQLAQTAGAWFDRRAFHKQVTSDIAHLFGAEKCVIFRWGEQSGCLEAQVPAYGVAARDLASLALDIGDPSDPNSLWQDLEERDYLLVNESDGTPDSVMRALAPVDDRAAILAVLRVSGRVHGAILIAGRDQDFAEQDGQLASAFAVPVALAIEDAESHHRLLDRVRQLASARDELERLGRTAESIRRPFTVIRGYLELFLDGALGVLTERQMSTMGLLSEKAREVAEALNQFLPSQYVPDVIRYESVDLVDLVGRVLQKWVPVAESSDLELMCQVPATQDGDYVTAGDPALLFGAFDALLDNAVKYSPDGGTIQVLLHDSGETVYVEVTDPGIGIPVHRLPQIWESPKTRSSTVMSLAEVKRTVEEHGGYVWAESQPGLGSTFYVVLPRIATAVQVTM